MQLARVMGSVVSTQKLSTLVGRKLLLVQPVSADGDSAVNSNRAYEVAVDAVGAGEGELVLLACGSSARQVFAEPNSAIDLAVIAIVDSVSVCQQPALPSPKQK